MQQLKPTYNNNDEERMYRKDESGKEFVYYKDKKKGLIIRDFFEEDVNPWINAMFSSANLTPDQKKKCVNKFKEIVKNRKEDDVEYSLVITSLTGKILGEIEIADFDEEESCGCEISISMRDNFTKKQKEKDVIQILSELYQKYHWYDKMYLKDNKGIRKEIQIA